MKNSLPPLLVPPCLILAAGSAVMASTSHHDPGPAYSVGTVRMHLTHDAKAWVGHTILVRGEIVPCMAIPSMGERPCAALVPSPWQPNRVDPAAPAAIDPLLVVRPAPNPVIARLRRVPLLGELVPAPQVLHWGAVATYWVQLRASPNSLCGTAACFEAVLLDGAAPSDDRGG